MLYCLYHWENITTFIYIILYPIQCNERELRVATSAMKIGEMFEFVYVLSFANEINLRTIERKIEK